MKPKNLVVYRELVEQLKIHNNHLGVRIKAKAHDSGVLSDVYGSDPSPQDPQAKTNDET